MESQKKITHEIGGVKNDALRFGLHSVKSHIFGSHPLESAYVSGKKSEEEMKRKDITHTYGALPLKMNFDRQILAISVLIVESSYRMGGRIHNDYLVRFPVDLGASWKEDESHSLAVQIEDENHYDDLLIVIVLLLRFEDDQEVEESYQRLRERERSHAYLRYCDVNNISLTYVHVTSMAERKKDLATVLPEKVCLDKLELGKNKQNVILRVLRMWEARNFKLNGTLMSLDLLLLDEKDTLIQVSIHHRRIHRFKDLLEEGTIYLISNFEVVPTYSHYKVSDNPYTIRFMDTTQIVKVAEEDCSIKSENFIIHNYAEFQNFAGTNLHLLGICGS